MTRAAAPRRRSLHPVAWWLWAAGLAICAMRTNNPFLLALIGVVACVVVSARRSSAPWSRSIAFFLRVGVLVIVIRIVIEILFGQRGIPGHVLFTLPQVPLPSWAAAVSIGGPVTLESILNAFVLGLQLAVILLCFGAANSLASPYRLLRSLPAVLVRDRCGGDGGVVLHAGAGAVHRDRAASASSAGHSDQRVARHAGRGRSGAGKRPGPLAPARHQHGCPGLRAANLRREDLETTGQWSHRGRVTADGGGHLRRHRRQGRSSDWDSPCSPSPPWLCGLGLTLAGAARRARATAPIPWRLPSGSSRARARCTCSSCRIAGALDIPDLTISFSPLAFPSIPLLPVVGILIALLPAVAAPNPMASSAAVTAACAPGTRARHEPSPDRPGRGPADLSGVST